MNQITFTKEELNQLKFGIVDTIFTLEKAIKLDDMRMEFYPDDFDHHTQLTGLKHCELRIARSIQSKLECAEAV